jgi:hypothetical protein
MTAATATACGLLVFVVMGAALELIVLPTLLVTAVVVILTLSDFGATTVVGAAAFLALLYFATVKLLRQLWRWDRTDERGPRPR